MGPKNPSFLVDTDEAAARLAKQRVMQPKLVRPVVVLSGYADPGIAPYYLRAELGKVFNDDRIIGMSFYTSLTMDECRARLIEKTHRAFPSHNPNETVCVDVVAHSMGGLVARYAAMDLPGKPRLRIERLFTIATPHQGATIAYPPSPDPRVRYMHAGSEFLETLDWAFPNRDYEMICYTRLGDTIVPPKNAAPPNYPLWWVPNLPLSGSHVEAPGDPRIFLDIVRRLRYFPPITVGTPTPLPSNYFK
ncbi:esterase/lipase family protein [Planctomycetota bacterium]